MALNLFLPTVLYAVVGYEINIYFHNIAMTVNPNAYSFEVTAPVGRTDSARWYWIPDKAGEQKVTVSAWNDEGKVAEAETTIIVSPADAGAGRDVALLQIGASVTVANGHSNALHDLFQKEGNPKLTMQGSHGPGYGPAVPGGPANEAYGGWSWHTFFTKTKSSNLDNDGLHPARPNDSPSPFLFKDGDQFVFDFARYLEKYCDGRKPDIIIFSLGTNALFSCKTDADVQGKLDSMIIPYMEQMIAEIRKVAPDVVMGVELIPTGSSSQDAFGANYGTSQSRRRWLQNARMMFNCYIQKSKELGFELLPVYVSFDCVTNYPVKPFPAFQGSDVTVMVPCNALHPTVAGYRQWAASEYFWLKHVLAK